MMPDPQEGKYYRLTIKDNCRSFHSFKKPLVFIEETGELYGKVIFRTGATHVTHGSGTRWFMWDHYDFEYIGELV